jgi:chorismate mutase
MTTVRTEEERKEIFCAGVMFVSTHLLATVLSRHEHKTIFCLTSRTLFSFRPVRMTSVRPGFNVCPACHVSRPQSVYQCVRFFVVVLIAVFNENIENVFLMLADVYHIQIRCCSLCAEGCDLSESTGID